MLRKEEECETQVKETQDYFAALQQSAGEEEAVGRKASSIPVTKAEPMYSHFGSTEGGLFSFLGKAASKAVPNYAMGPPAKDAFHRQSSSGYIHPQLQLSQHLTLICCQVSISVQKHCQESRRQRRRQKHCQELHAG